MYAFASYFAVIIYVMGTILANSYVEIDPQVKKMFFNHILEEHNKYRKIHGSQLMKFDDVCCTKADETLKIMLSQSISSLDLMIYGLNSYSTDIADVSELNANLAKRIVAHWYEKGANYNYLVEPTNSEADAFTQLVWNDSYEFGLQMLMTTEGKLDVAAIYYMKGNIKGEYLDNVMEPNKPVSKNVLNNLFKGLNLKRKKNSTLFKV